MLKSLPVGRPVPGDWGLGTPCSLTPVPWIPGPLSANWPFPGRPDGQKHTQALGLRDGDAAVFLFYPGSCPATRISRCEAPPAGSGSVPCEGFLCPEWRSEASHVELESGAAPRPPRSGVRVVQAGLGQRSGGAPADPAGSPAGQIPQLHFVSRARARRLWGRGLPGPRSHIPGGSGVPFSPPPPQCSCS